LVWGESDSPDSWTLHFVMTDIAFTVQDGRARCTLRPMGMTFKGLGTGNWMHERDRFWALKLEINKYHAEFCGPVGVAHGPRHPRSGIGRAD
jgi:hypothetical protein